MALPPESSESFIREVDENLRRDQAEEYLKKNGPWLIGAALIFLAAIAGWFYWQNHRAETDAADSERLASALEKAAAGSDAGLAELDKVAAEANEGIATQAKFAIPLKEHMQELRYEHYEVQMKYTSPQ